MKGTFKLKGFSPYIYDGIVGHIFHLSLWQRIKLLFYQRIEVVLVDVTFNKEYWSKDG